MIPITPQQVLALQSAIMQLTHLTAQQVALAKAGLKQRYTVPELQERYGNIGADAVRSLCERCGVWPKVGPGHRPLLCLDEVLKVDALVNHRLTQEQLKTAKDNHAA